MEFDEKDHETAEKMAKHLGYKQTVYTTSSDLWGLFCLPDRSTHRHGCIVKTKEFGLVFIQDKFDMYFKG